jgi:hypothetical protein
MKNIDNNINIKKIESEIKIKLQEWCEFLIESGEEGVKGKVLITAGNDEGESLLTIDFSEVGINTAWRDTIYQDGRRRSKITYNDNVM